MGSKARIGRTREKKKPRPGFEPGSRPFDRHPEGCDSRMLPLHHLGFFISGVESPATDAEDSSCKVRKIVSGKRKAKARIKFDFWGRDL